MSWKPDLCIYHDNCNDGFGAAYAVWRRWGDGVKFVPRQYGMKPPDIVGKNVLIVDFSFKKEILDMMIFNSKSVVIIDHHVSAKNDLSHLTRIPLDSSSMAEIEKNISQGVKGMAHFDMSRSGAMLVWKFLNPDAEYTPTIIQYIQDRDLWLHKMEDTVEFNLALSSYAKNFLVWDHLANNRIDDLIEQGIAIKRYNDIVIASIAAGAAIKTFSGFKDVPVVNSPPIFSSDVGNRLLVENPGAPFSVCWSVSGDGVSYSLRSEDGREDVSAICVKYGGGGHRNAAGFRVPRI